MSNRTISHSLGFALLLLFTSACHDAEHTTGDTGPASAAHSGHGDSMAMATSGSRTGEGRGVIKVVDGVALTIDHGPISGIGMGAMTMRFEATEAVSTADLEPGDNVVFKVKVGRDSVYRIMALCKAASAEADCQLEP